MGWFAWAANQKMDRGNSILPSVRAGLFLASLSDWWRTFMVLAKRMGQLTVWQSILTGAAVGFGIYFTYASLTGEWIMRSHHVVYEQLLVYTLAAAFFGLCYHAFILKESPHQSA